MEKHKTPLDDEDDNSTYYYGQVPSNNNVKAAIAAGEAPGRKTLSGAKRKPVPVSAGTKKHHADAEEAISDLATVKYPVGTVVWRKNAFRGIVVGFEPGEKEIEGKKGEKNKVISTYFYRVQYDGAREEVLDESEFMVDNTPHVSSSTQRSSGRRRVRIK